MHQRRAAVCFPEDQLLIAGVLPKSLQTHMDWRRIRLGREHHHIQKRVRAVFRPVLPGGKIPVFDGVGQPVIIPFLNQRSIFFKPGDLSLDLLLLQFVKRRQVQLWSSKNSGARL